MVADITGRVPKYTKYTRALTGHPIWGSTGGGTSVWTLTSVTLACSGATATGRFGAALSLRVAKWK